MPETEASLTVSGDFLRESNLKGKSRKKAQQATK
jgi:hypothetical protein